MRERGARVPPPRASSVYLGGSDGLGVSRLQLLQGLCEVLGQERTASSDQLPLILLAQAACQTARRSSGSCLEDLTRGSHPSPHQGPGPYSLPHQAPPTHYFLLSPLPFCVQLSYPEFLILVQAALLLWVKRA